MLGPAFERSEDDHDIAVSRSLCRYDCLNISSKKKKNKKNNPVYYSSLLQMGGTATCTWPLSGLAAC